MKTHFSDNEYAKRMAHKMQRLATCLPPAILFEKSDKKSDKSNDEKEKYKTFDIKLNKTDKNSEKVEISLKVFENGSPEDFCKWFEQYNELKTMMSLDTASKQIKIIRSILKDTYLETFNTHIMNAEAKLKMKQAQETKEKTKAQEAKEKGKAQEGKESETPKKAGEGEAQVVTPASITNKDVTNALKAVTLKAFSNDRHAYRRQVRYMRYQLYFTTKNFDPFFHRLKQLNKYLKYFPIPPQKLKVNSLSDEDLIEIIDNAKPVGIQFRLTLSVR